MNELKDLTGRLDGGYEVLAAEKVGDVWVLKIRTIKGANNDSDK